MATVVETQDTIGSPPLVLRLRPVIELTDDQLLEFCALNSDLRIELTTEGDLLIMPPVGSRGSSRNAELVYQLKDWARRDGTGVVFDSSGGFRLPNRAVRAPDASWVPRSRLAELTEEQFEKYAPLCPDFVVELRSSSDRLADVSKKMQEYMENGAQLGWLIDPYSRLVYVYRPQRPVETLENPSQLAGEPLLPGFVLDLSTIW